MNFSKALSVIALGVLASNAAFGARVTAGVTGPTAGSACFEQNSTGARLTVTCSDGPFGGSASGVAAYRYLGVAASSFIGLQQVSSALVVAGASADEMDYLTVVSPGRTGSANLTFSFVLNSAALNDADAIAFMDRPPGVSGSAGTADIDARLTIAGQTIRHAQSDVEVAQVQRGFPLVRTISSSGVINNVPVANALGTYQYSVPIILNQEFSLAMALSANVYVTVDGVGSASASVDAMNSFDWGGIQGVTVDGQPVEFSVTSQSGTDWTSPIPEVPTLVLLIGGLGVVLRHAAKAGRVNPRQMISK